MASPEPIKFLLVDDIEENLHALEALLRRDGLAIFRARSGRQALELLLRHDFALALLDVQMPEIDGFELAELMRGTERTRSVPIIFITAAASDEGRRFRGYEAGAVDFIYKPIDPLILKTKAQVFFDIASQHRQLARQKDELAFSEAQLRTALERLQAHTDNSPLAIVEFDPGLRLLTWSKGAERLFGWTADEMVGYRLDALAWVPDGSVGALMAMMTTGMADSSHSRGHDSVRCRTREGAVLDCEWYSSVLRHADGRAHSLSVQILDVTAQRKAEETRRLLIGELNHRVKNTLASVQAIATQTLRHTRTPEQFSATFTGRIQALARAHSMLSATMWQGASLAELVHDQIHLGTIDAARVSAGGPEVKLSPQTALRLALILHELSTNAIKYGAFANATGRVALHWTVTGDRLDLRWEESGGPPVTPPARRGFGSTLIEGSLRSDGGGAGATYRPEGVVWDLRTRLDMPEPLPMPAAASAPTSATSEAEAVTAAPAPAASGIEGRSFLVVEDETLVALDLIGMLETAGARVVGPAGTVGEALALIEAVPFDAAFLDGNLNGAPVDDVAAALARRGIRFSFVSGYGRDGLPAHVAAHVARAPVIPKPFTRRQIVDEAARLTGRQADAAPLRREDA